MGTPVSPDAYAFKINQTIQAAFGPSAYPLKLPDLIHQFAGVHAPGVSVTIQHEPMSSLDGALIASSDKKRFTILVNADIGSVGRANFTMAHEFGHLLLHRALDREFRCSTRQVHGLTNEDVEVEANRFASQLMLPNNFVREVADGSDLSLDDIKRLASRTGASLTAAALACATLSSRPFGFVVIRDGFIKWGRATDAALKMGLYFKSGKPAPEGSAAAFEGDDQDRSFERDQAVEGWACQTAWKEQGFYSARYQEAYFLLTQ